MKPAIRERPVRAPQIFGMSNLDEFFMVRVAAEGTGRSEGKPVKPDGRTPQEQLEAISKLRPWRNSTGSLSRY